MNRAAVGELSRWAWFATESGKRFSLGCMVALGGGAAAFNLLPHTLLLDEYRELFQLYKKSTPVRVSPGIKKQFNAVVDDLKLPEGVRARLKPFMAIGFDIFHAGTTHAASGALIGVPVNFNYETIEDIDRSALLIQGRHLDPSTPDGEDLLAALTLSDDAKKFAIGREIVRSQTVEPILNAVYPASCVAMAYSIGHKANNVLGGFGRPLAFRIILYTLTGLFAFGNWALFKDITTVHYDTECDKEMCKLGRDYIKGGQEFYSAILKRNVALRNLMGNEGPKIYSASGNEEFFVRHKRMPIVHRKLYFDGQMESLN